MSGLELPTVTSSAAWFTWEPLTPGACMALAALLLAAWGLWQMRTAATARNKQLDAQERIATDRHRETMRALEGMIYGLETVIGGLETVIERTTSGRSQA